MHRILVVDGDAESREMTARVLSREGYAVEVAATAAEARKLCAGGRVDLLVADVALPDGDGWSLMRDLVRECGQRGIALSAHARTVDEQRSSAAGFFAHAAKSISVAQLTEFVRSALSPAPEPAGTLALATPSEHFEVPAPATSAVERRKRAIGLLQESERALVREAAILAAEGANTSGLTGPMMGIQQALAELQGLDAEALDADAAS